MRLESLQSGLSRVAHHALQLGSEICSEIGSGCNLEPGFSMAALRSEIRPGDHLEPGRPLAALGGRFADRGASDALQRHPVARHAAGARRGLALLGATARMFRGLAGRTGTRVAHCQYRFCHEQPASVPTLSLVAAAIPSWHGIRATTSLSIGAAHAAGASDRALLPAQAGSSFEVDADACEDALPHTAGTLRPGSRETLALDSKFSL